MREILFRGKRTDNGEWVYGNFFHNIRKGVSFNIIDKDTNEWFEVYPETVGQYTYLKDKKGVRIFEGDLVDVGYGETVVVEYGVQSVDAFEGVGFNLWGFYGNIDDIGKAIRLQENIEVVGSIHDKIK